MNDLHISTEVAELLGDEIIGRIRARDRHPDARCFRCDGLLNTDRAELVVEVGDLSVGRVVLAHPSCEPSAVIPSGQKVGPSDESADILLAGRAIWPQAVVIVDITIEVLGRHGNNEVTDLRVRHALATGFELWIDTTLEVLEAREAPDWQLHREGERLTIAHADGTVLWEGNADAPSAWDQAIEDDGAALVVFGSRIGLKREGLDALESARRRGGVVKAVVRRVR